MSERDIDLEETIKTLLAKVIEDDSTKDSWTIETNIIDDIGIDSLQIVKFMMAVEDELGISINYEDLTFDDFSSIGALKMYLEKQM